MTRTEADLITSLDNRVRAKDREIEALYELSELQVLLIEKLSTMNAYLQHAVELLSLPRPTEDDIQFVRDGILMLECEQEGGIRH
jgi:hypothetical protein